jgi:hypothetical protein
MEKNKTLLSFRISDGEKTYSEKAIIDNKQRIVYSDKEIISKFFYDNDVSKEQFLSDGRSVRIEGEILITDEQVEIIEKLRLAFLYDFSLEEVV